MIVGFDVCHETKSQKTSYGAFVATMNDSQTSYFSCTQPHTRGQDMSNHFSVDITSKIIFSVLFFWYIFKIICISKNKFLWTLNYQFFKIKIKICKYKYKT